MNTGVSCHFPSPGDLPNPGIEPASLTSGALADGFFTTSAAWRVHTQLRGEWLGGGVPQDSSVVTPRREHSLSSTEATLLVSGVWILTGAMSSLHLEVGGPGYNSNHFTILCWSLPHVNMNWPRVHRYPLALKPLHLAPQAIPLSCPRAQAPGALLHAPNLHWPSILRMVIYMLNAILTSVSIFRPHFISLKQHSNLSTHKNFVFSTLSLPWWKFTFKSISFFPLFLYSW